MSKLKLMIAGLSICLALAGCSAGTPIVAGAVGTVGGAMSAGTTGQGGDLTVGDKGAKFAVVPVQTAAGQQLSLRNGSVDKERGFSVLAMLGIDAKGAVAPVADIQQVVAVGPAADIWALGRSGLTADDIARAKAAG